jgi:hypothetical protein
LVDLAGSEKND